MNGLQLSKRDRKNLIRIVIALALFCAVFVTDKIMPLADVFGGKFGWTFPFAAYSVVYLIIGYDVLLRAARNILHGQVFDENFLMCVATLGAFGLAIYRGVVGASTEGFDEACAVLLFYQVGEFFQSYVTGKSRRSIAELMDVRPDFARVVRGEEVLEVEPTQVVAGERILVRPGERVPLDGVCENGASALDTRAITGESLPREIGAGDEVLSGCVNLTSEIEVRVKSEYAQSTVSKILDLVENASEQKSKAENFITRFSAVYTPAVVIAALLLAIVPSLVTGEWSVWIYRALSFLVVSCPCALVISVPLSFFAGIGAASRCGILVKGSNYLEKLDRADTFVFDKTGTLTKGNFVVSEVYPQSNREEILRLAAIAENHSSHPIARSVLAAYGREAESGYTLSNIAGEGVFASRGEDTIVCGNEKLMLRYGISFDAHTGTGTNVYVARGGQYVGRIVVRDELKKEAPSVIGQLRQLGCRSVMLTGDNAEIAAYVAEKSGVSSYKASLLPQDKVREVESMLNVRPKKSALCFVGDGINDAPVLMRSDVGIAMGGIGSDAAVEAADIVLMQDDLRGLTIAKKIAKKTICVVRENVIFSLAVKGVILLLSALGFANMWLAVFGDVGVAVLAILNAMRVGGNYAKKEKNDLTHK